MLVAAIHQHESAIGMHKSYISLKSLLNLPLISYPIQPLEILIEPQFDVPEPYSKSPLAIYFTYGNVSFRILN